MIVAGEASGDQHGAKLVSAMRRVNPELFACGIGGGSMKAAGVRILVDARELSVVGITEVVGKLPTVFRALTTVKKLIQSLRPDLVILIDFPDFNFRVAAAAQKAGVPVLYYISPQIWAWRPGRVKKIARLVDHMAVILPFEAEFYRRHGIPVTFVGHPLLDGLQPTALEAPKMNARQPSVVGLLPGSRQVEISRLLPVMLAAAQRMLQDNPVLEFVVSVAPSVDRTMLETAVARSGCGTAVRLTDDPVEDIFRQCRMVIAASGTVTLQAALHGTPMIIIYRVSPSSYWLGRLLIRVKFIGLVNLIADRPLVPELIQDDASPENIARCAAELLGDEDRLKRMRRELLAAREALGGPGASQRVADIALGMLHESVRPSRDLPQ
jgi:lipid-A-disaccharide synthase